MHITQINIQGFEVESAQNMLKGCVALISGATRIQVDCAVFNTGPANASSQKSALVHEAIRQLRRMPEYRRGDNEVSLADGLLPV